MEINQIVIDTEKRLVEVVNNSGLPLFVLRLILRGLILEIDNLELRTKTGDGVESGGTTEVTKK